MSDTGTMVAVDGTDAVAVIILRPSQADPDTLAVQAHADGIGKRAAGHVLRQVADMWDPGRDFTQIPVPADRATVDRVAAAIQRHTTGANPFPPAVRSASDWDRLSEPGRDFWRDAARAALTALTWPGGEP